MGSVTEVVDRRPMILNCEKVISIDITIIL